MKASLESLLAAQSQAQRLFEAVIDADLIAPGRTESAVNREVFTLAKERFGVAKYWHKRIVRAGPNTVLPYRANPPDHTIQTDDIVFLDFGPVFGDDEADFGRTYVIGQDPRKHKLAGDLPLVFASCRAKYLERPQMTGADLYHLVVRTLNAAGYRHENPHAGHLIGFFPHEKRIGDGHENYICPENDMPMNAPTASGEERHWILEVHAVHHDRQWGGFVEEILV